MVLLVGLASLPTLAALTVGSREIAGQDRGRAMDVPFLPPPSTGPVRTAPDPVGPVLPSDLRSAGPVGPTEPDVSVEPSAPASVKPSVTPSPTSSEAEKDHPRDRDRESPRGHSTTRSGDDSHDSRPPKRSQKRPKNEPSRVIPVVPDLPRVPEEHAFEFPSIPDLPRVPDDHFKPATSDEPCPDADRTVHKRRSTDRARASRRSAVSERPYNIRATRILEQSWSDNTGANSHRMLDESRTGENRVLNRPYRGLHRAEHTSHEEHEAAQRDSRVGRHHAEPSDDRYRNRR
ncbi:hypothetical protein [Actinoplanes sp. NBRC 101535]|uniref:hypothetical protein n=1 Tax=Actinoplanes sp. NBRC 101535 TaxID=3032196 RepID=UPI002555409D|nr:hypothetical protein [Actinoplanes sp. NBRC 101535]